MDDLERAMENVELLPREVFGIHQPQRDFFKGFKALLGCSRSGYTCEGDVPLQVGYWEHFLERGHRGKVLSVGASEDLGIVVSGGSDYTARIWVYDMSKRLGLSTAGESFELAAVILHDAERQKDRVEAERLASAVPPLSFADRCWGILQELLYEESHHQEHPGVCAVGCAGTQGPVLSATTRGTVAIFELGDMRGGGAWVRMLELHTGRVNGLSVQGGTGVDGHGVLKDGPSKGKPWHFVTAGADSKAVIVQVTGTSVKCQELSHDGPVLGARFIEHIGMVAQPDWVSVVTATSQHVLLWSLQGECKSQLDLAGMPCVRFLTVANRLNGSLILAGQGGDVKKRVEPSVNVWAVERGTLVNSHGKEESDTVDPKKPLTAYKFNGSLLDVDKSGTTVEFAAGVRDDYKVVVWNLAGVEPGALAIEPRGPASRLVAPDHKNCDIISELAHSSKVTSLFVTEDGRGDNGGALLAGTASSTIMLWDLEGIDGGEITSELRSLRPVEFVLPVIFLVVTWLQVISFAFGPATNWNDEVQQPVHVTKVLTLVNIDQVVEVEGVTLFFWKTKFVIGLMLFFLFWTLLPTQELLEFCKHWVLGSHAFRHRKGVWHWPTKILYSLLALGQKMLHIFLALFATLGVVPMFKSFATVLDCNHSEGVSVDWFSIMWQLITGVAPDNGDDPRLAYAPSVHCFQGEHRTFCLALYVLVPFYLFALIPYALVSGDPQYVSTRKLWLGCRVDRSGKHVWKQAAKRRATRLNRGYFHVEPETIHILLFVEVLSKAALPVIVIVTTGRPQMQVILVALIGAIMLAVTIIFPPRIDRKFCRFEQGIRALTLCSMLCGCLTVFLGEDSNVPLVFVSAGFVAIPIVTAILMSREDPMPVQVLHWRTKSESSKDMAVCEVDVHTVKGTETGKSAVATSLSARNSVHKVVVS